MEPDGKIGCPRGGIKCVGCGGLIRNSRFGNLSSKGVDRFKKSHGVGKKWGNVYPCIIWTPEQPTLSKWVVKRSKNSMKIPDFSTC